MRRAILLAAAAGAAVAAGGCGTTDTMSSASLKPRLLPAGAIPGFSIQRTLDWSNPIDLVGQGVALPDITPPSAAVRVFRKAKLEASRGEVIQTGSGLNATEVRLGVAEFGSTGSANDVRAWMHGQDLQQPCFTSCVFTPRATPLPGVPSSSGVIQTEAASRPGSPANYRAEFTIGPYLYWVWFRGNSSAKTRRQFKAGVGLYYEHVRGLPRPRPAP